MASADPPQGAAGDNNPGLLEHLRSNPWLPLVLGVAIAITILAGVFMWSTGPDYSVLYSGLSDRDGGEIIGKLDQMQVPYRFAANGSTILVPHDAVDQTRLSLAGEGLPKGAGVGFELMDNQSFGISQFAEHVNYNRALEGELARSIETINEVASARVHLAIPESSVFVRERQQPTASVVLDLYDGRSLSEGQVSAIAHLVSSSVTQLPVDSVTVVDAAGHLLSQNAQPAGSGANGTQLDYVAQIEQTYRKRIRDILAPIVGADNVRAQVVADVDFSVGESTRETYAPNQDPSKASVRSEQRSVNLANGGAGIKGIPGALSNRPSPDEPSPINNPQGNSNGNNGGSAPNNSNNANSGQLQTAGAAGLAQGGTQDGSSTSASTINYEIDRTIQHTKLETGRIRRLSAAVVINEAALGVPAAAVNASEGQTETDSAAASADNAALVAQRMQQIQDLVRGAIGYSSERGDSLQVVNTVFTSAPQASVPPAPPWWQNRDLIEMAKTLLKYLALAIVAWLLWRKLVKPLIDRTPGLAPVPRAATAGAGGAAVDSGQAAASPNGQDGEAILRQQRRQQYTALLDNTQELARSDPRMVAMIVKGWMSNG
ncbi:flagellar basal-body MS-ring/collar protein FliF [Salinisphaera aquimarina]|uniref:Flagellar M-ring protein n=1 Tax=Salinisphaera aquimarina TaxID=2094031 RepID=A0ABV7ERF0_9GAMM